MAWTLIDAAIGAIIGMLLELTIVFFFKRGKEDQMQGACKIVGCMRQRSIGKRGLCLVCYSAAKKKVESGHTTWKQLVEMGLCDSDSDSPFDDAYSRATDIPTPDYETGDQ